MACIPNKKKINHAFPAIFTSYYFTIAWPCYKVLTHWGDTLYVRDYVCRNFCHDNKTAHI